MSEVALTFIAIGVFLGTACLLVGATWWYASTLPDKESYERKADKITAS